MSEISPELRAKLGTFYKDRLLDHRDTWGDEVAKKDSSGNYVISPKLTSNYLSDEDPISEEEVREKLEKSGLDIPKDVIEGYILNKETQENNSADLLIDQIYQLAPLDVTPGADKVPGFWRSGGPVGSLLGIRKFITFVEANKKQGLSSREIVSKYKKEQGRIAEFITPALSEALLIANKIARGVQSTALSVAESDYGDTLLETQDTFNTGVAALDSLRGSNAKYSRMVGGEVGLMAITAGGSRIVSAARPWYKASTVQRNSKIVASRLDKLASNLQVGTELRNASKLKEFSDKLALSGYTGLQTSRALTNFYSDSYLTTKRDLIASGTPEEEAKVIAKNSSILPSILAGAVTWGLMKVFPDGAESFFAKGKLTKKELASALQVSQDDLGKLLSKKSFKDEVSGFLTEEVGLKGLFSGGKSIRTLKGALIGGGREAIEEGSAEFIEGLIEMWTFNEELTLNEALKGAGGGALLGGFLGSGVQAVSNIKNPLSDPVVNSRLTRIKAVAEMIRGNNPRTAEALDQSAENLEQRIL